MPEIADSLRRYGENATTQIKSSFERLTPKQSIRLVVLVCAYVLFRKYVLAHAAKRQARQLEAEAAADEAAAKLSPNDLRGGGGGTALEQEAKNFKYPGIPYDTDEEEEDGGAGTTTGADGAGTDVQWGKKARSRQRKVLKMLVDAEEKKLKAKIGDDDDQDIQEFLVDGDTK